MLPSSRVGGQLLLAHSNEFNSRPCDTSSVGSSIEVASEDVTTGNNMPSKADMALKNQAAEADMTLPCLQVPSNHIQDHAFKDACKQGEGQEFTVQDIFKDTCKHLPNIQPQGSDIVRSAPWSHALMDKAYN